MASLCTSPDLRWQSFERFDSPKISAPNARHHCPKSMEFNSKEPRDDHWTAGSNSRLANKFITIDPVQAGQTETWHSESQPSSWQQDAGDQHLYDNAATRSLGKLSGGRPDWNPAFTQEEVKQALPQSWGREAKQLGTPSLAPWMKGSKDQDEKVGEDRNDDAVQTVTISTSTAHDEKPTDATSPTNASSSKELPATFTNAQHEPGASISSDVPPESPTTPLMQPGSPPTPGSVGRTYTNFAWRKLTAPHTFKDNGGSDSESEDSCAIPAFRRVKVSHMLKGPDTPRAGQQLRTPVLHPEAEARRPAFTLGRKESQSKPNQFQVPPAKPGGSYKRRRLGSQRDASQLPSAEEGRTWRRRLPTEETHPPPREAPPKAVDSMDTESQHGSSQTRQPMPTPPRKIGAFKQAQKFLSSIVKKGKGQKRSEDTQSPQESNREETRSLQNAGRVKAFVAEMDQRVASAAQSIDRTSSRLQHPKKAFLRTAGPKPDNLDQFKPILAGKVTPLTTPLRSPEEPATSSMNGPAATPSAHFPIQGALVNPFAEVAENSSDWTGQIPITSEEADTWSELGAKTPLEGDPNELAGRISVTPNHSLAARRQAYHVAEANLQASQALRPNLPPDEQLLPSKLPASDMPELKPKTSSIPSPEPQSPVAKQTGLDTVFPTNQEAATLPNAPEQEVLPPQAQASAPKVAQSNASMPLYASLAQEAMMKQRTGLRKVRKAPNTSATEAEGAANSKSTITRSVRQLAKLFDIK